MPDFREFWARLRAVRVEGRPVPYWYQGEAEPAELYRLAGEVPSMVFGDEGPEGPLPIVELGTYCGVGAACLAAGVLPGGRVFTVDPHVPGWDRGNNVSGTDHHGGCRTARSLDTAVLLWTDLGLLDRIEPVTFGFADDLALAAVPGSLGLLFLDAEHQTTSLEAQLVWYAHRVAPGGLLVAHDCGIRGNEPEPWDVGGVVQAWVDGDGADAAWEGPHKVNSLWWWRRTAGYEADYPDLAEEG